MVDAAIQRRGVYEQVAGFQEFEQHGGDSAHSTFKHGTIVGLVPKAQAVFQNFQIGVVDAAVNQAFPLAVPAVAQAIGHFKMRLAFFSRRKYKRGGLENGAFDGAFRPFGPVSVRHHEAFRMKGMILHGQVFSANVIRLAYSFQNFNELQKINLSLHSFQKKHLKTGIQSIVSGKIFYCITWLLLLPCSIPPT